MGWFAVELEPEVRPVVVLKGSLVEGKSVGEEWGLDGDEGGEGRAPVRKRSERAV